MPRSEFRDHKAKATGTHTRKRTTLQINDDTPYKFRLRTSESLRLYRMLPCFSYFLIIFTGLSLAAGAPQRQSYPSVDCKTEYITVWETEYEERESQECVTKWVPECKMVFKMQCKPTYREVVNKSKNLFHSLTPFSFLVRDRL